MYDALSHFVTSDAANSIIDNVEYALKYRSKGTYKQNGKDSETQYERWSVIRNKTLTEENLKYKEPKVLLASVFLKYLYGAFVWSESPQNSRYWGLILDLVDAKKNYI